MRCESLRGECLARIRTYSRSADLLCGIPRAGLTASLNIFTKQGLLFCVDAQREGKRFIVKADDLLTAFVSPERRDSDKRC